MLRELAASGQKEEDRLVLNIKVPSAKINQKIEQYLKEFVLCRECGKPDTELVKEDRLSYVKSKTNFVEKILKLAEIEFK